MPKLNMTLPHHISQEEVRHRIFTLYKDQSAEKISDLREEWKGNVDKFSFSTKGLKVSGILTIKSSEIELCLNLPFAATFFKGKIESEIRERVKTLLA